MIRNDEREICETHKRAWIFFLLACTLSVIVLTLWSLLYPGVYVALISLLTYPVSTSTAERSFSGMKRLQTPLRRTMTDETDWVLLQFCIWAQGRNWYWWHYNRICLSKGYTSRPLLLTSLIASLFSTSFPEFSPTRPTERRAGRREPWERGCTVLPFLP